MTDRETEPLPTVSHLPERMIDDERSTDTRGTTSRDEEVRDGSETEPALPVVPVGVAQPETHQEVATVAPETIPEREQKQFPSAPVEPPSEANPTDSDELKKVGKVGRKRKYDELGEDTIEPVKEVIFFRHQMGRHWPGLSKDMQDYYDYWYFEKPNKRKDGKDYARHVKCWERKERWINGATTPLPDSHALLPND